MYFNNKNWLTSSEYRSVIPVLSWEDNSLRLAIGEKILCCKTQLKLILLPWGPWLCSSHSPYVLASFYLSIHHVYSEEEKKILSPNTVNRMTSRASSKLKSTYASIQSDWSSLLASDESIPEYKSEVSLVQHQYIMMDTFTHILCSLLKDFQGHQTWPVKQNLH